MNSSNNERLLELLADRATVGLVDDEKQELRQLFDEIGVDDDWSFDQTAAILDIGLAREEMSPLPSHLRQQVIETASDISGKLQSHADETPTGRDVALNDVALNEIALNDVEMRQDNTESSSARGVHGGGVNGRELVAWLAVAACLALAAFAWFTRPNSIDNSGSSLPLIASATSLDFEKFQDTSGNRPFEVNMNPGNDISGTDAKATVVWDRATKKGYVKVTGLRVNDPQAEQYQLWVIDRIRGVEDRPNAGVFDIAENGELYFEFRSDLKVFEAQGFAITVEKPGGVNKSDLSRIALANLGV